MKYAFIDTETTGLFPHRNALTQIHIRTYDGTTGDYEDHSFKARPHEGAEIEDRALEVQGVSREEILSYPYPSIIAPQVRQVLQANGPQHFVAYNAPFDEGFLRSFLKTNEVAFPQKSFHWPIIDIAAICSIAIGEGRFKMENFKLPTVYAAIMGRPLDKAHSALGDAIAIYEIFKKITNK